ncbi:MULTISPECIES: FadR/GntR family transcriptional regulator [Marinobacter]|jgi:DNA-binding FadR family transcriptional regulator|uniref:HTH-type transcriptional regulator LutR n=1 Tax=Marinobacter salarius TaxID=1420917 RepID=A0A1W6KA97_9GAMM|nr:MULTISPECIES: FadR/GntR family transcriptional regulator [Marinobacter]ARM84343.1 HTH-type transcriptional regulator LutR [Marinobacter salarius]AZR43157.1 exu regulon transcriptional regulator [Marinobacter salarius]MAB50597.1 FadR family transcriptional regulator [Marinobacter sp.]MCC4282127.1 FadR family transcriptional regulator [Marinobacter salarius]MDP4533582.1 FadR/GntR family transcriptional regulator [Marinobacter salarius]|tara:strand:+ start:624 stop:1304 length:681 start_codon:yes stop_codon:yes gene_type:complete
MQLARISKGSLVETAIESLRQAIEKGHWAIGERLPVEAQLSESLGVSRNTVREAVRVLVHVGMLETRQGDGTYVRATKDAGETLRRINRAQLRDKLEVRIMLETEAAKLAAERRDAKDLERMTLALDERAKAGDDVESRIRHDHAFHTALVAASHNPALSELYDYFANSVAQTIELTELDSGLPEPSQEDHELLLAAIRRQDSVKAETLSRALLQPSLKALGKKHP